MRTPDSFYKETAEELGIDLEIVTKANKYFWKEGVRKEMAKAVMAIYIGEIGTLYATVKNARREILKIIKVIRMLKGKNAAPRKIEEQYENLRAILKLRSEIFKVRQRTRDERKAYRIFKTSVEGSGTSGQSN